MRYSEPIAPYVREGEGDERTQYLTFAIADAVYAIGVRRVREIIEYGASLTRLPRTPAAVRGTIDLRGSTVPVVDLAVVFGGAERPITPRSCLVIVETLLAGGARNLVGLLADAVAGVADLRRGDIAPAPACGAALRADALTGIGTVDGTYLLLLDIDRALADTALPESFTDGPYTTEETSC